MKTSDICAHIPTVEATNKLAHQNEINTISDTLDKLNSIIELEARRGHFSVKTGGILGDAAIEALRQIGYRVERESGMYTIRWSDTEVASFTSSNGQPAETSTTYVNHKFLEK